MSFAYFNENTEMWLTRDTRRTHTRSLDRFGWSYDVNAAYVGFLSGMLIREHDVRPVKAEVREIRVVRIL